MDESRRGFFKKLGAAVGTVVIAGLPKKSGLEIAKVPDAPVEEIKPSTDPFAQMEKSAGEVLNALEKQPVCRECGLPWEKHFAHHPTPYQPWTTVTANNSSSSTYLATPVFYVSSSSGVFDGRP